MRAAICLLLLACAADKEPLTAESGTFLLTVGEWESGDCTFEAIETNADSGEVEITVASDASRFDLLLPALDRTLRCPLEGRAFDCEPLDLFDESLVSLGLEAEVQVTWSLLGEWPDDDHLEGQYAYGFTCEGADCSDLSGTDYGGTARFPCSLAGPASAERQG
jgi:hypothetical protein